MKDWYVLLNKPSSKKVENLFSLANAARIPVIPAELGEKAIGFWDGCFSTWAQGNGERLTYNQAVQLLTEEINEANSFTLDVFTREVVK